MRLAQHLAILRAGRAALAPGADVVGVHIFKFPNFSRISLVTDSAV